MTTIAYIDWTCPACGYAQTDDIDNELGPFLSCTCGQCGKGFDQDKVEGLIERTVTT